MKARFYIENYPDVEWVMVCETREEASTFTSYLHSIGRAWQSGTPYSTTTRYRAPRIGYLFNKGTYIFDYEFEAHTGNMLNFKDFDWDYQEEQEEFNSPELDNFLGQFILK